MRKIILLSVSGFIVILIFLGVVAEIISFRVVKKTTDQINKDLNRNFQKIVLIPAVIPPSYRGYYQTIYNWEMETPQNEVIRVIFTHDTGFSRSQNKITATLSMEPGADASLFNKVLPAVIADEQALSSAKDYEHVNLSANSEIGYQRIKLEPVEGDTTRMTRITWEFDKSQIAKGDEDLYSRLNSFPEPILTILYSLQQFTIRIFSG